MMRTEAIPRGVQMRRHVVTLACAFALAACGGGVETVQLGKGEGFDFNTRQKVTGVRAYDQAADAGRLVYPSETGCPDLFGNPMTGTVFCGWLYHLLGPQAASFQDASAAFAKAPANSRGLAELMWPIVDEADVHWTAQLADRDNAQATVVWLVEYDAAADVATFQYSR
jgi:hypothetical protein